MSNGSASYDIMSSPATIFLKHYPPLPPSQSTYYTSSNWQQYFFLSWFADLFVSLKHTLSACRLWCNSVVLLSLVVSRLSWQSAVTYCITCKHTHINFTSLSFAAQPHCLLLCRTAWPGFAEISSFIRNNPGSKRSVKNCSRTLHLAVT